MSTAGNLTPANKIDDSRWVHGRVKVAEIPRDAPSSEDGVYIHYIACPPPQGSQKKGTVLLIHGFPQTSYQFRRVITPITNAGYEVIAPDYRGAGGSSKPWNGYTKRVMADDLHTLMKDLGYEEKVHIVGHDIGGMIAHAYTVQFPNDVASIAWGECPLPGTDFYHETKSSMPVFHFTFHAVPDLPELLVAGKERIYLKHFFDRLAQNPASISTHDLDVYATEYAQPGAMRAGMNCYRTFEQDGEDNNAWVRNSGKCPVRCLALWGAESFSDEKASTAMCDSFYENVSFHAVPGAGHWIAEEKPAEFVDALVKWFGRD